MGLLVLNAPAFSTDFSVSGVDSNGKSIQISASEKPMLLHFWATWCLPCLTELPELEFFSQRMRTVPIQIVAVSVDETLSAPSEFFKSNGWSPSFSVLLDPKRDLAKKFKVEKFPESFLIDSNGNVLRHFVGAVSWARPELLSFFESRLNHGSSVAPNSAADPKKDK